MAKSLERLVWLELVQRDRKQSRAEWCEPRGTQVVTVGNPLPRAGLDCIPSKMTAAFQVDPSAGCQALQVAVSENMGTKAVWHLRAHLSTIPTES